MRDILLIASSILVGVFSVIALLVSSSLARQFQECESEMPRNQYCKLIAVPEDGE